MNNFYLTSFINGLIYKFFIRIVLFFLSILPLSFAIFTTFDSKIVIFPFFIILIPFLIIILTGLLLILHRNIKTGEIELGSKSYFYWLNKNLIHETICSSSFLNNLANRVDFIKLIYYKLCGFKNPQLVIIAPEVKFLDPYLLEIGKKVFIGYGTIISGHIIQGKKLFVKNVIIKDNVRIGASCFISCGVEIGENSQIGFGVKIGSNCKIGKNVIISSEAMIDENVLIEDNSYIGKCTIIGKNSTIKYKNIVSFNETIKPKTIVDFRNTKK